MTGAAVTEPWEDRLPRHGHVYWHDLTPLEGLVMLAAMIDASNRPGPKADRHTTYLGILAEVRARFDPGRRWAGEDVGDAVFTLTARGALSITPGRVHVLAWPVPGGAPW